MSEFSFLNVAITISAATAKEAYTKLCEGLSAMDAEYQTDVYTNAEDVEGLNERPTRELFPTEKEQAADFKRRSEASPVKNVATLPNEKRYSAESLLSRVIDKQTAYWNVLRELEQFLGFEIDSSQDFRDTDLDTILANPGAPV